MITKIDHSVRLIVGSKISNSRPKGRLRTSKVLPARRAPGTSIHHREALVIVVAITINSRQNTEEKMIKSNHRSNILRKVGVHPNQKAITTMALSKNSLIQIPRWVEEAAVVTSVTTSRGTIKRTILLSNNSRSHEAAAVVALRKYTHTRSKTCKRTRGSRIAMRNKTSNTTQTKMLKEVVQISAVHKSTKEVLLTARDKLACRAPKVAAVHTAVDEDRMISVDRALVHSA